MKKETAIRLVLTYILLVPILAGAGAITSALEYVGLRNVIIVFLFADLLLIPSSCIALVWWKREE